MFKIPLEKNSRTPIYKQICIFFRRLILQGALPSGYRLPAERKLAAYLSLNRTTVVNAYKELVAEGLVSCHVGRGTIVRSLEMYNACQPVLDPPNRFTWSGTMSAITPAFMHGKFDQEESIFCFMRKIASKRKTISFVHSIPNSDVKIPGCFRAILERMLHEREKEIFQRSPMEGIIPLRECALDLMRQKSTNTYLENLLITNSTHQALDLVARLLVQPDDIIIIEEPAPLGLVRTFVQRKAKAYAVPVGDEEEYIESIHDILHRTSVKMIVCSPTFQNPTGLVMSSKTRKKLLHLAHAYKIPIIEYDPYSDLYFDTPPPSPVYANDGGNYVIYIGAFPKNLPSFLRLGWICAPRRVITNLIKLKKITDLYTECIWQWVLNDYYRSGEMEGDLVLERENYKSKALCIEKAVFQRNLIRFQNPAGGYHLWCSVPEQINTSSLLTIAGSLKVIFLPGSLFFTENEVGHFLRLSFPYVNLEEIREGIGKLENAILGYLQ